MALVEVNRDPSRSELRSFGFVLPAFFGVVGGLLFWRLQSPHPAQVVWCIGLVVALLYLALPQLRRPLYLAWMHAFMPIGWVVSHGLLAAIYYGVVTPIGLSIRLFRGDPLKRTFDESTPTYWTERDQVSDNARYFRQS